LQYTGGVGQITNVTVKGVKVAVLGFSVYSWGASLNNIEAASALVKQAAAQADLVVIQMQGGAEGSDKSHVPSGHEIFLGEDRGDLKTFSHAVIDAGADVVFGHGPHIMRGMEFYKGRLVAYSLGNFCGYRVLGTGGFLGVGGVLKVTLHKDGTWAGGKLVPTKMINGGIAAPDDDKRALDFVAGLSREDFRRRRADDLADRRHHHRARRFLTAGLSGRDGSLGSVTVRETELGRKRRARRMARLLEAIHPDAHCELDHGSPLELAVATILSAQCTDQRVNEVTPILFRKYPTAAAYAGADRAELETLIKPTGFFRNKTDSLIKLGQALVDRYGGEVPGKMADLDSLPGIGRKTANVILGNAFGVPG
jgi:hypothetical protein